MDASKLDLPDPDAGARRLSKALQALSGPLFAVMDGALFDDLPGDLMRAGITCRSLFLDHADRDVERAGAWFMALSSDEVRDHVVGLAAKRPCAVFWECPAGADKMFRHLRGINMILYPKAFLPEKIDGPNEAGDDEASAATSASQRETHEMVLFRHADPNVMAQTVPALTEVETARLLGAADSLLFLPHPEWADGDGRVAMARADRSVRAPTGLLRLSEETVERIGGARHNRRHRRLSAYLRKVAPEQTEGMDDDALEEKAAEYAAEAQAYGVRSEAGQGRWCYLQTLTGGALTDDPNVHRFMTTKEPGVSPDQRVRLLLQQSAATLRSGRS